MAKFGGLIIGCIEADFCESDQISVHMRSKPATRLAMRHSLCCPGLVRLAEKKSDRRFPGPARSRNRFFLTREPFFPLARNHPALVLSESDGRWQTNLGNGERLSIWFGKEKFERWYWH